MRLLLVDDDHLLSETLAQQLIRQRYAVDVAANGEMAGEFVDLFSYDLIILDMLLPDTDGLSICHQFRQRGIDCPILMLTANDNRSNKIKALDTGANDYVVKPFDFEELFARIRVLLRGNSPGTTELQWGALSLNPVTLDVFYDHNQIHLTPKEYAMLELFLRNPSRVFSLDAIIDNLWSFDDPPGGDAVRTHVKGLRQKLKAGGAPKDFVETVYGLGYRLKAMEAAPLTEPSPSETAVSVAIAQAWDTHQDMMQERLNVLEATVAALGIGRLSSELQHAGRSQAHKLAGSLGCFGFAEGSRLARELERLLELEAPLEEPHVSQVSSLLQDLRHHLANGTSEVVTSAAIAGSPQVLMVSVDPAGCADLTADATTMGIRSRTVESLSKAQSCLKQDTLDAAVIWVDQLGYENTTVLLREIAALQRSIPTLLISDIQNFQQRLNLVQQGADRILPTKTVASHVVKDLRELLQANHAAQIVMVDDDPQVLKLVKTLLTPWGIQLAALETPAELWQTLNQLKPDLLILDVEMPTASGLELCQVLRPDDQWRHLPVLFLTIHEDTQTQQAAFNAGADDFVSKAAMAADLPSRIVNRLKRTQL